MNLNDRHIIVTGAAAGIGFGIVQQCLAAGANVTGFDVNTDGQTRLIKSGAQFVQVDVSDADDFEQAITEAYNRNSSLDGLVNNAGITINTPFFEMTLEQMDTLWAVNQRSVLVGCQSAGRIMTAQKYGSIVNIASNHASATSAGHEAYAATKAAIVAMTRAMAWSLGPHKVRVNALCPGMTQTEKVDATIAAQPEQEMEFRSWFADDEISSVQEIGNAAVFLLSDASSAFHGASLTADRGMSALLAGLGTSS